MHFLVDGSLSNNGRMGGSTYTGLFVSMFDREVSFALNSKQKKNIFFEGGGVSNYYLHKTHSLLLSVIHNDMSSRPSQPHKDVVSSNIHSLETLKASDSANETLVLSTGNSVLKGTV